MNPWVVNAAALAALAAVVVAVLTWLQQRDVTTLAHAQEHELTRLRADLSSSEARLRNDLARDLAAHESRLRVQSEMRLRLFERSAECTRARWSLSTQS